MEFFNFRLRNAPAHVKIMIGCFLLSLGLAYVYALGNIAIVVGLTPKAISVHYYGTSKKIVETAAPKGEESLDLNAVEKAPEETVGPRPSFKNLVQEGHFHLFGMTSFFFLLTTLGLFTSFRDSYKAALVGLPFLAIILDNISFMATRFLGPKFAYLTAISGGMMGVIFTILWLSIALEITKKQETL